MTRAATIADALAEAARAGVDRLDAHLLMGHLLDRSRTWLLANDDQPLPPAVQDLWRDGIARRAAGEPLAYLVGVKEFHGLSLAVGPAVLVPRPDTETLVDWALEHLPADRPARVLDLGTGSGAIALALRHQRPALSMVAVDASEEALAIAERNGQSLELPVDWRNGSWWRAIGRDERFDLVVSNPPYIAEGDPHLPALRHEPRQALTAGPDGLSDLHHIIDHAPPHLADGAWLLLEHGHDQGAAVRLRLSACGFTEVSTRQDLAARDRCTGGRWRVATAGSTPAA